MWRRVLRIMAKASFVALALCTILPGAGLAQSTGGPGTGGSSGTGGGGASGSGSTVGGPAPGASCTLSTQHVSLHIPNESSPPGGVVQMKLMVTEPTPISGGGPRLNTPKGTAVRGIHLFNPAGDVEGVATLNGSLVSILYVTSNGTQGNDYPIMTVALQIPASTAVGTQTQFNLDQSSTWNLGLLGV